MPHMQWQQAGRKVSLPFSVGLLIKEIVPKLGVQRWLAAFGYHPLATIRVPDCGCTDPLRCRCDFPGHPHGHAAPDLWADYALLVLRLRRPQGWLDLWLLDIGVGAVVIAEDDIAGDPIPTDASIACQMGWCDLCDGTRHAGDTPTAVHPPLPHRDRGQRWRSARGRRPAMTTEYTPEPRPTEPAAPRR